MYIEGFVLLAISVFVFLKGNTKLRQLEKYDFENRSSGGVVQFENFEASKKHQRQHRLAHLLCGLAGLLFMIAIVLIGGTFIRYSFQ